MRRVLPLIVLLALVGPSSARAGIFAYAGRCTQIGADPPRYQSVIHFHNRFGEPIFGIRAAAVGPGSSGAPMTPILHASGPSWMHVTMDGNGWPTWVADQNWPVQGDSLTVVTAVPTTCLSLLYLVPPEGDETAENGFCLSVDPATPTQAATWGRLKTLYR